MIEKAYAKLHNVYQALTDGKVSDAIHDFSGLPTKILKLRDVKGFPAKNLGTFKKFWRRLIHFKKSYKYLTCIIQKPGEEGEVLDK